MNIRPYRKQAGAILVMFTIALFSLLVVAAMALDGGHMLLNKGRLQNAVDASALQAGKVLQGEGTQFQARQAATELLIANLQYVENSELEGVVTLSSPDYNSDQVTENLFIEFSEWPDPFIPDSLEGIEYVRVRLENVGMQNFFAQIIDFNKSIRASAVAGRSTDIACFDRIAPLMVCANDDSAVRPDPVPSGYDFGFLTDQLYILKTAAGEDHDLGPGNFQPLRTDGNRGANDLKGALAGDFTLASCIRIGDEVPTEPGNKPNAVTEGLNTRFGEYPNGGGQNGLNEGDHKRDVNTCTGTPVLVDDEGDLLIARNEDGTPIYDPEYGTTNPVDEDGGDIDYYSFFNYDEGKGTALDSCIDGDITTGALMDAGRRMLPIVVGDCTGKTNGANTVKILGTGCFFLTQKIYKQGNRNFVVGEFVHMCGASGATSLDPTFESNSSTIVLFRDSDSPDS
ncbi:TadE/TadG family type IV pilus assembly protein [Shewanella canadensis]|nr:TadE/TadG family type IV pilus assembly protein [Shewanella canadensis]